MNREFLQLAQNFKSTKHSLAGWYASEKLDGMRAYWDGGISRGRLCDTLAYANTAKDTRLVERPIATGLWSRYAKPIHAPDWFLDLLPEIPLDGELYLSRGQFQELISIVKQHQPDERWLQVKYMVFDSPPDLHMFMPGKINNPNCKLIMPDLVDEVQKLRPIHAPALPFYRILDILNGHVKEGPNLNVLKQKRLPSSTTEARETVEALLSDISDLGGEGLIVRKPESVWFPKRVNEILKFKKLLDDEAIVLDYTWGKGKLEGLMGAMKVQWKDKIFELSGFTDTERKMCHFVNDEVIHEPGSMVHDTIHNLLFPRGSIVTFRYTEVSKDGIPLKARYYRVSKMRDTV